LFRYGRFVEEHLQSALGGMIYFSNPASFNDPWDCKPWFSFPADAAKREQLIQWFDRVARKTEPHHDKEKRAQKTEELRQNPDKLKLVVQQCSEAINADLGKRYRVCCLTTKPACPLMWAHYGDRHHGICLEFDVWQQDLCSAIKVQYRETYPMFPLDDGTDISPYYTKSAEWAYEDEYRLIAQERDFAFDFDTLITENGFYRGPKSAIKSVIIGALASAHDRVAIEKLVDRIAPDVAVRHAKVLPDRYQLAIDPPLSG
jgi:hypothetical protein